MVQVTIDPSESTNDPAILFVWKILGVIRKKCLSFSLDLSNKMKRDTSNPKKESSTVAANPEESLQLQISARESLEMDQTSSVIPTAQSNHVDPVPSIAEVIRKTVQRSSKIPQDR